MRKHAIFGIAALAMILFATSLVADVIRPKAGHSHVVSVSSFLPGKALEPAW